MLKIEENILLEKISGLMKDIVKRRGCFGTYKNFERASDAKGKYVSVTRNVNESDDDETLNIIRYKFYSEEFGVITFTKEHNYIFKLIECPVFSCKFLRAVVKKLKEIKKEVL